MTRSRLVAFLTELKRRKVYHVAVAYVAVGSAVCFGAPDLFAAFDIPSTAVRFVVALVVLGFPLALVLAWLFDVHLEVPQMSATPPDAPPAPLPVVSPRAEPGDDPRPSLAVLPFASFSDDLETDYFGLGVMDDVLSRLAHVKGIRLVSRTSCMRYRAAEKCTRDIARELGVRTILEGSVRRSNGRVRVVAQLIDGETDEHLWADTYDRDLKDVFGVQTEIAERIAGSLVAQISEEERAQVRRGPTENLQAWEMYLRALQTFESLTARDLAEADRYLAEAVRLDPGFASAWALRAELLVATGLMANERASVLFPKIRLAAQRALELDPKCAEAHAAVALVKFFHDWDPNGAEEEFEKAFRLDPDGWWGLGWRGLTLALAGRQDEGLVFCRRAASLEPLSSTARAILGEVLCLSERLDEALSSLEASVALWPGSPLHWKWLGITRLCAGDPAGAVRDLDRAVTTSDGNAMMQALRAQMMAHAGRTDEARAELARLKDRAAHEFVDPWFLFCVTLTLDGMDAASSYIEPMLADRSIFLAYLNTPRYRPFLGDPRFRRIVETVLPGVPVQA